MQSLIAQNADFDWSSLVWIALVALSSLGEVIRRVFKKDDAIEAEFDDEDEVVGVPPQPQRPVMRPGQSPRPAQHSPTPTHRPAPARPPQPRAPQHNAPQYPPVVAQPPANEPPRRPVPPARIPQRSVPPQQQPTAAQRQRAMEERERAAHQASRTQRGLANAVEAAAEKIAMQNAQAVAPPTQSVPLDAAGLRQAIVISEILSPPVALRKPGSGPLPLLD